MKNVLSKTTISIFTLAVAIAILTLSGCDIVLNKAHVRFQNNTDYTLFYGIKFGDAEYRGEVAPGFISSYLDTEAGTYSLQALTNSGQWTTISNSSLSVTAGHKYSIVGTGTSGSYYWNVVQDQ